jgi:hypothetical protein
MPEPLQKLWVAVKGHGGVHDWPEIEIGLDAALAHHRRASRQHGRFCSLAANRRDEREPVESLMQGNA